MARSLLFFVAALMVLIGGFAAAQAQSCAYQKYCSKMRSCAEADYYFRVCGHSERDGDNDGIPCETLCGKTKAAYKKRLALSGGPLKPSSAVNSLHSRPKSRASATAKKRFSCQPRKTCSKMASCEEAKFHLQTCGNKRLDRDRNGIPCEALCR